MPSHNTISPCKGCTERRAGCHDDCERYAQFRKDMDEMTKKEKYDKWLRNISVPEAAKEKIAIKKGVK